MGKYFKVGKLLIDIEPSKVEADVCIPEGTMTPHPCRFAITPNPCNVFISPPPNFCQAHHNFSCRPWLSPIPITETLTPCFHYNTCRPVLSPIPITETIPPCFHGLTRQNICQVIHTTIPQCGIFGTGQPGCTPISPIEGGFGPQGDPPIDLTNPQVIAGLKEQLTHELERLEKIEKVLEADLTPSSPEEVAAIEKQLNIAQNQLDEARKDLAQKKSKLK